LIKATGGSLARLILLKYQKTDFQTFKAVKKQKPSFVEKLGFFSYKVHDFLISDSSSNPYVLINIILNKAHCNLLI